jgi:hypothetical protein
MIGEPIALSIRRKIERPPASVLRAFKGAPTGFVTDAFNGKGCLDRREPVGVVNAEAPKRPDQASPVWPSAECAVGAFLVPWRPVLPSSSTARAGQAVWGVVRWRRSRAIQTAASTPP